MRVPREGRKTVSEATWEVAIPWPNQPLAVRAAVEAPRPTEETRTEDAIDLPWQVVVHNDPVNLMTYVSMVFQRVFGFPKEKAEKHMMEVHQQGRSIVWSGMRERGELYVQQLHGHLLLATLERTN